MDIPPKLLETVQQNSIRPPSLAVSLLVKEILSIHGEAVQAILFYGSCLSKREDLEGLFDLYILVNTYTSANRTSMQAVLNKLLPPNVFYLEVPHGDDTIRAKYAVLSLSDLQKGTSLRWFHSYLWARFCQPTALVYVRNEKIAEQVTRSLAQAIITFITRILPRISQVFTLRDLWSKGLELTYRSEFRPEQANRQVRLFDANPDYYEDITRKAFAGTPYQVREIDSRKTPHFTGIIPAPIRAVSRFTWALRILQGKILSALRLIKGTLTFDGGVDYILWKIKRHSGVALTASPFLKRHPILAMFVLSWRLYKRGGIR
jgi:hypothetical protein